MNDKQVLQKVRKMILDTHWIKGSLEAPAHNVRPGSNGECTVNNGNQEIKIGYCLVGMVVNILDLEKHREAGLNTESVFDVHNQGGRIIERLFRNLPELWSGSIVEYSDATREEKAHILESYNDRESTKKEDILALVERAIAHKVEA